MEGLVELLAIVFTLTISTFAVNDKLVDDGSNFSPAVVDEMSIGSDKREID